MIFSVTERGTYKRCRRRWDYASLSRQALTPIKGTPSLSLGSIVHGALEDWVKSTLQPDPCIPDLERLFLIRANAEIDAIKERYKKIVGIYPSEVELGDLYEAIMVGKAMMANYQSFYGNPVPEGFEIVKPEQQLVVRVPGTRHRLEAKIDLLLRWIPTGKLFIMDHKTYKMRPRDSSIQQNDQFLAYLWVLSQVYPGQVGGFIYDGLWKRETPPRGGTIDDLFHRQSCIRPPEELAEFGANLANELREMGSPKTPIYPNRQWQGCWDCGFENLCTAQSRGESWEMIRSLDYAKRDQDTELSELEEAV